MDAKKGEVRYGTAGWSYADWYGPFYPTPQGRRRAETESAGPLFSGEPQSESSDRDARLARENPLAWYARWFDVVEVDASFYRLPAPRTVEKWVRTTERAGPRPFLFTFKLPRTLTHEAKLDLTDAAPLRVAFEPALGAGRLAAALAQFPWSFRKSEDALDRIERLRGAFSEIPLVVEVRHGSWDDDATRAWLSERGIALAAIDQPRFRDSLGLKPEATARVGYVRLHGRNYKTWWKGVRKKGEGKDDHENKDGGHGGPPHRHEAKRKQKGEPSARDARYDYLYEERELDEIAASVDAVAEKAELTVVIANNHFRGQAPANALELRARRDGTVPVPPTLARAFPRIADLARL